MAISHHEQNMNGQKEAFQRKRPFRPICALITSGTWQDDAEVSREPRTENKESKKIGPGWKWLVLVVESIVLTFVLPFFQHYFTSVPLPTLGNIWNYNLARSHLYYNVSHIFLNFPKISKLVQDFPKYLDFWRNSWNCLIFPSTGIILTWFRNSDWWPSSSTNHNHESSSKLF